MNAPEQWERLNRAINVKHYIGPNAHKCIEDKILSPDTSVEEAAKAPIEPVKGKVAIAPKVAKKV